jgi:hypothetical protein
MTRKQRYDVDTDEGTFRVRASSPEHARYKVRGFKPGEVRPCVADKIVKPMREVDYFSD